MATTTPRTSTRLGVRTLTDPIAKGRVTPVGDGPPADFKGPIAAQPGPDAAPDPTDAKWDSLKAAVTQDDADDDAELEELIAQQAADAAADGIQFGDTDRLGDVVVEGLIEPVTFKLLPTGDTAPFAEAPKLTEIVNDLINEFGELRFLQKFKIEVLWRQKGGTKGGAPKLGATTVMSGYSRYKSGAHFQIWLAADHIPDAGFTEETYRAYLYHRLSWCGYRSTEDGEDRPCLDRPTEVFPLELERFGLYRADLNPVKAAMQQKSLFEPAKQMTGRA